MFILCTFLCTQTFVSIEKKIHTLYYVSLYNIFTDIDVYTHLHVPLVPLGCRDTSEATAWRLFRCQGQCQTLPMSGDRAAFERRVGLHELPKVSPHPNNKRNLLLWPGVGWIQFACWGLFGIIFLFSSINSLIHIQFFPISGFPGTVASQ